MQRIRKQTIHALTFAFAAMLVSGTVLAEKPSWAGDKSGKHEQTREKQKAPADGRDAQRDEGSTQSHFDDRKREIAHSYFAGQFRAGRCPPGLAKKNNGCMPPGQAKKWAMGQPLPQDVIFYNLPPRLVTQIGPPPTGHRYVRVASDILMIAVGTGMVVDAIEDLGRM